MAGWRGTEKNQISSKLAKLVLHDEILVLCIWTHLLAVVLPGPGLGATFKGQTRTWRLANGRGRQHGQVDKSCQDYLSSWNSQI